jgi:hypothetical protein
MTGASSTPTKSMLGINITPTKSKKISTIDNKQMEEKKQIEIIARSAINRRIQNKNTQKGDILNYFLLFVVVLITIFTFPQNFLDGSNNKVRTISYFNY